VLPQPASTGFFILAVAVHSSVPPVAPGKQETSSGGVSCSWWDCLSDFGFFERLFKIHTFYFWGLGFELRPLCLLSRHSTTCPNPFCFVYFWDRISPYAQVSLGHDFPRYASSVARMRGMQHHTQLLLFENGDLMNFLPRPVLNYDFSQSLPTE
jgi:hypothetical protein